MPGSNLDNINILLVDDSSSNLVALEAILSTSNYNLVSTTSAKEAFSLCDQMPFAVALIDVHMPVIDGFELAKLIRSKIKDSILPIIFLTAAEESPELLSNGYKLGAADFLFKPLNPDALKSKVSFFVELYKKTKTRENLSKLKFEKVINENIKENEKQLRLITDALPVLINYVDRDQRYTFINKTYELWWNKPRSEGYGKTVKEMVGEKAYSKVKTYIERALSGEKVVYESDLPMNDGSIKYIHATYLPDMTSEGFVKGFFGLIHDITKEKEAQLVLEKQKEATELEKNKFEKIFAESPAVMALVKGPQFIFEKTNKFYQQLIGNREVIGKPFVEALPEYKDSPLIDILKHVFETGEPFVAKESKNMIQKFSGGELVEVFLNFTYERVTDSNGKPYGIIGTAIDVTEQVLSRQKIEQLARDLDSAVKMRDEFISIASHELNTPLTSLKLQMTILRSLANKPIGPDKMALLKISEVTDRQVTRIHRLVQDMVDSSIRGTGKLTFDKRKTNLTELMNDVLKSLQVHFDAQKTKVNFKSEENMETYCDPFRIEQVFYNLLINALKYGKNEPVEIDISSLSDTINISVKDYGIGIKAEDIPKLFSKFGRVPNDNNIKGFGLGLYITKKIIDEHDGTITVESKFGKGSTFIIKIPKN